MPKATTSLLTPPGLFAWCACEVDTSGSAIDHSISSQYMEDALPLTGASLLEFAPCHLWKPGFATEAFLTFCHLPNGQMARPSQLATPASREGTRLQTYATLDAQMTTDHCARLVRSDSLRHAPTDSGDRFWDSPLALPTCNRCVLQQMRFNYLHFSSHQANVQPTQLAEAAGHATSGLQRLLLIDNVIIHSRLLKRFF